MDNRTGQIVEAASFEDAARIMQAERNAMRFFIQQQTADFVQEIEEIAMTEKQKADRKVSLKDHKTVLGKRLGEARNKPCPCGSGLKLKKCCGRSR